MNQGVYIGLSGAKLQELRLEITANNLANANSSGYKADKVSTRKFEFELVNALGASDMAIERISPQSILRELDGLDTPLPFYKGTYSKTAAVETSFEQGPHKFTGNPLNIALDGPGFVVVETPNGTRYTRQGSYQINSKGDLVTSEGHNVRGNGLSGLGNGLLSIDSDGNVYLDGRNKGRIDIVEFTDPHILRKEGNNLFATKKDGNFEKKGENTSVKQGFIEMPNTNVMKEMVNLIELNRLYESYQKAITTMDETTKMVINGVGG